MRWGWNCSRGISWSDSDALLVIGISIIIPGLGIAVAGAHVGAGEKTGGIMGVLTKAGLSSSVATEYKDAMDMGHIIVSVEPNDRYDVILSESYGREIYIGMAV